MTAKNVIAFLPEHPRKCDQNLQFILPSEMMSLPDLFIYEYPPGGKIHSWSFHGKGNQNKLFSFGSLWPDVDLTYQQLSVILPFSVLHLSASD